MKYLSKDYLISLIISVKSKYYNEHYTTNEEIDYIINKIRQDNENTFIQSNIDNRFYCYKNGVYILKTDIDLLKYKYFLSTNKLGFIYLEESFILDALYEYQVSIIKKMFNPSCSNCDTLCYSTSDSKLCKMWKHNIEIDRR